MRILITGAGGQLATDVERLARNESRYDVVAATIDQMDIGVRDAVLAAVTQLEPDLIVHTAAWTAVDDCESEPDEAWRVNALGSRHIAEAARLARSHLVALSTDYVFDGTKPVPYTEWDIPNPQSVYGHSKLAGEQEIQLLAPDSTVVRTSWLCGPHGSNMVKTVLGLAAGSTRPLRFVDDQHGCPTFTEDLAGMLLRLGVARRPGMFHATNQGPTTWYQFARDIIACAGGDPAIVEPISTEELDPPRPAKRPANSVLDNATLRLSGIPLLPDHHEPLERTIKTLTA